MAGLGSCSAGLSAGVLAATPSVALAEVLRTDADTVDVAATEKNTATLRCVDAVISSSRTPRIYWRRSEQFERIS